jgi:cell division transport system permease protein
MKTSGRAIPFGRDGAARFLPWSVALMVYLAALALAGVMTLERALAGWDRSVAGTLTVELPPANNGGDDALLASLRAVPGVKSATLLERAAVAKLVEPFLGNSLSPDDLSLPRLIDLRVDPSGATDLASLRAAIATAAPGSTLDDHRLWLDRLQEFGRSVELTALAILALIGGVAVLTVIFVTRAGLSIHHEQIELLHLMGAKDGYIAHAFEREALRLAFLGGLAGLALAGATLIVLGHAAEAAAFLGDQVALIPALHLKGWNWAALAALAPAAGLVAALTARLTVLTTLLRLP